MDSQVATTPGGTLRRFADVADAIRATGSKLAKTRPAEVRKPHQLARHLGKVAVAARRGALASLEVLLFSPVKPMLATAELTAEGVRKRLGDELWVEDKFDGIRSQGHRSDERV